MATETAIVVSPEGHNLATMANPPEAVLQEAKKAAQALRDVVATKPKPVVFNGEQYLEFEDWQTLGRFYGITSGQEGEPSFVEFPNGVAGFKATSVAMFRGQVISRATAYCLNDEEKWRSRPKYEYHYWLKDGSMSADDPGPDAIVWEDNPNKPGKKRPKKERVRVADENVPLFQLASMAQTRSNAKALGNVLRWVAVLAGYRPTPAEEMMIERDHDVSPAPKAAPRATSPSKPTGDAIALGEELMRRAGGNAKAAADLLQKITDDPSREFAGLRSIRGLKHDWQVEKAWHRLSDLDAAASEPDPFADPDAPGAEDEA